MLSGNPGAAPIPFFVAKNNRRKTWKNGANLYACTQIKRYGHWDLKSRLALCIFLYPASKLCNSNKNNFKNIFGSIYFSHIHTMTMHIKFWQQNSGDSNPGSSASWLQWLVTLQDGRSSGWHQQKYCFWIIIIILETWKFKVDFCLPN
jgi:hypothetical protein